MVFNMDFNKCNGCSIKLGNFLCMCMDEDKTVLLQFLMEHGVLSNKASCPRCQAPLEANQKNLMFSCQKVRTINKRKKNCNYLESLRNGTFFSKSNLKIDALCQFAVHWITRDPPRINFLSDELEFTSVSISRWASECRNVTMHWVKKNYSEKLGGIGKIVEIDVVKFGEGNGVQHVFGGIERESRKVFLVPVPDVESDSLLLVIKDKIVLGTTLISCLKSLECLSDEGYSHVQVKTSNFVDPESKSYHIQNIGRLWRDVYTKVPKYGRKVENYEGYLSEFLFKKAYPDHTIRIHSFFKAIGECYTPDYIDRCV